MTNDGEIAHVSDTALMVAACRAIETDRSDGLIRDPFAARLAGDRGMAIARNLPLLPMMNFGIALRSRLLDELVVHAINEGGIETVLCLGAGLDSRPWRLDLPAELRWVEVDLPAMLDYKREVMSGIEPRCTLKQMSADLNNPEERRLVFDETGQRLSLMITEGLLMYLPGATVQAIAVESAGTSGLKRWLLDLQSSAFGRMVRMNAFQAVQNVRAAESLSGEQIREQVQEAGWRPLQARTYQQGAAIASLQRLQDLEKLRTSGDQPPPQAPENDFSGVHLFGRD